MYRFLFGGRGLSSGFHVGLILSLCLPTLLPSLYTNLMQENSVGALWVHPFFIWRLTTSASSSSSSSLDWDPGLSQKGVAREEEMECRRKRRKGVGEKEVENRRNILAWEESVYMQVYVRHWNNGGETKEHGESGWRSTRKETTCSNCIWNFSELLVVFYLLAAIAHSCYNFSSSCRNVQMTKNPSSLLLNLIKSPSITYLCSCIKNSLTWEWHPWLLITWNSPPFLLSANTKSPLYTFC